MTAFVTHTTAPARQASARSGSTIRHTLSSMGARISDSIAASRAYDTACDAAHTRMIMDYPETWARISV